MDAWNDEGQTSLDILKLVLVLAETTEEEDVGVLGRRRAGSRWNLWVAEEVDEPNHAREDGTEGDGHWVAWLHMRDGMQSMVRRPQRRVLWDFLQRQRVKRQRDDIQESRCIQMFIMKVMQTSLFHWRCRNPKRALENHWKNNWVEEKSKPRQCEQLSDILSPFRSKKQVSFTAYFGKKEFLKLLEGRLELKNK